MTEAAKPNDQIVVDRAASRLSDLWKKEDYWAIWLGFLMLIVGIVIYFNNAPADMQKKINEANAVLAAESTKAPFKTVAWYKAVDAKKKLKATSSSIGKTIKKFTNKPHGWSSNPLDSLVLSEAAAAANDPATARTPIFSYSLSIRLAPNAPNRPPKQTPGAGPEPAAQGYLKNDFGIRRLSLRERSASFASERRLCQF